MSGPVAPERSATWRGRLSTFRSLALRGLVRLVVDGVLLRFVPSAPGDRILLVKADALGDYVLFRDFLAAVRAHREFVGREIVFCGNEAVRALAESADAAYVDRFVWIDRRRFVRNPFYRFARLRELRRLSCSLALHSTYAPDPFCADAIVGACGAETRIGVEPSPEAASWHPGLGWLAYPRWLTRWGRQGCTRLLPENPAPVFEFDRTASFFRRVLPGTPLPSHPFLEVPVAKAGGRYAVLLPGAGEPFRRWPEERFAEVARFLSGSLRVVVAGTSAERELAERICRLCPGVDMENAAGRLDLPGLASLLAGAAVVVGNDSGGVHLAAALGRPTLGISNGNHLGRFHPYPAGLGLKVRFVYPFPMGASFPSPDDLARYGPGSSLPISGVAAAAVCEAASDLLRDA